LYRYVEVVADDAAVKAVAARAAEVMFQMSEGDRFRTEWALRVMVGAVQVE
jgi:hypothetical protein